MCRAPVPLALAAAREAFQDAGIVPDELSPEERQQIGVMLGTGGGGLPFVEQHYAIWYQGGSHSKASVYIIRQPRTVPCPARFQWLWSARTFACHFDGLHQFNRRDCLSAQHIALGRQDVMIAGGVDAPLAPGILAGFNLLTVLTTNGMTSHSARHDPSRVIVPGWSWRGLVDLCARRV